jgi:mannose-6-phosphate isomerase-like protein (cupin superfamily)
MKTNLLVAMTGMTMLLAVAASHILAADAPAAAAVTYFDSKTVADSFAKSKTLLSTPGYKVMASRRVEPGQVEVHAYETDVFYIVEGGATFVTGGTVPDLKETSPGQSRGTSITGGEAHQLKQGDVIVIPAGIPHWFKEVNGPLLYFVVKPISASK